MPRSQVIFWFTLSLTFAVMYASIELRQAFSGAYVVQDDARQHVFWMQRFTDPTLFPNDLIADYFQSITPSGYAAFYRTMAALGIEPLFLNKLLPLALGLITTGYCFGVCLQLLPVPLAGFLGSVVLNQNLWSQDDLVSGTARAFLYPIFLAFLYYLLRRSLFPCLIAIALQGLFYPQFVFIIAGTLILRVLVWEEGRLRWSGDRNSFIFCAAGLAVAFVVLLPYALGASEYGPVVTEAAARTMPEFANHGRVSFFTNDFWKFWLVSRRSGALVWVMPLAILSSVLLPLLLMGKRLHQRLPLLKQVKNLAILPQVGLVSLTMFLAAHALLFKLYLPSRYMQNNVQILTALAVGVSIPVVLDGVLGWAERGAGLSRQRVAIASVFLLTAVLLLSPKLYLFPRPSYVTGSVAPLYEFFARQPKDILIASISREVDNLPSFSKRSILAGREYAIPYHLGYYRQIHQRVTDLIRAQYSRDLKEVQSFIRTYGIDFWLIDRNYLTSTEVDFISQFPINYWLQQFKPEITEATRRLKRGQSPVLTRFLKRCSVFQIQKLTVLDTQCIAKAP